MDYLTLENYKQELQPTQLQSHKFSSNERLQERVYIERINLLQMRDYESNY